MDKKKLETYRNEYIFLRKKIFDDINKYLDDKIVANVARKIMLSEYWLHNCKFHSNKCSTKKLLEVYESILEIGK